MIALLILLGALLFAAAAIANTLDGIRDELRALNGVKRDELDFQRWRDERERGVR